MEIPTKIDLGIDKTYTLRLPGLGTAGYLWTHEVIENGDLVDVSEMTVEDLQPDVGDLSTSVGSSRDEVFTIRALKAGHSAIRFVQKRPWESNQPPLKEYILEVDVKD